MGASRDWFRQAAARYPAQRQVILHAGGQPKVINGKSSHQVSECLLLAQSGHAQCADECLLLGAKRTWTNRCLPNSIYEYTAYTMLPPSPTHYPMAVLTTVPAATTTQALILPEDFSSGLLPALGTVLKRGPCGPSVQCVAPPSRCR